MSDKRLEKLLQFLQDQPDDAFLLFAVGKEYEQQDQFDKALEKYLFLRETQPEYIGLYYHLAKLYEKLDENILAMQTYNEGIQMAKKQADFHALSELNNAK
ncbi:MAG: hypothetical protein KJO29_02920, partial [Bacteroidia bacterium]|nr:hypothetical protein [Bacteroidia bacterium]